MMTIRLFCALILALALTAGCSTVQQVLTFKGQGHRNQVALIAINDVYRINGIQQGEEGSLARVRALRLQLQKDYSVVPVFLAGDFLSPSLLGRTYRGAHMIEVLNALDGRPKDFDPTLFVTFGNHEFDVGSCNQPAELIQRVGESDFVWLASNLNFDQTGGPRPSQCDLSPLGQMSQIRLTPELIELDGMKLGLFSITLNFEKGDVARYPRVEDYAEATRRAVKSLKDAGAEFTIALTHLPKAEDRKLAGLDLGPDLILGGHEHYCMAFPHDAPRVFKADADALSAHILVIGRSQVGDVQLISSENRRLDVRTPKDKDTNRLTKNWLSKHAVATCGDAQCLDAPIGFIRDRLEAEELKNKTQETQFGNWLADVARRAQKVNRAEAALMNAGSFALNYDLAAGAVLSRRQIEELIRFDPSYLTTVELTGAQLWQAVEHMLARRGSGAWAHSSGLHITVMQGQDTKPKLTGLELVRPDGQRLALGPESRIQVRLATNTYLACNGDGYELQAISLDLRNCMANAAANLDVNAPSDNMKVAILSTLRNARSVGVTFPKADRIEGLDPLSDPDACKEKF